MPEVKVTPKDFFMQLGAVVGLYVSAVSLLQLLFQVINYAFPDALDYYVDPYSAGVRWSIAMLLIMFPAYLLLQWAIERDVRVQPLKKQLWIRRWLSYLTLFVAGLTIAIDLVVLVNSFLGGEISSRFLLKVVAVLIVAGGVFGYYIYDLRREAGAKVKGLRTFATASLVFVLTSLVGGFLVMGSPTTARSMRFDDQRINDLSVIQSQVVYYWQRTQKLPENLEALKDPLTGFVVPTDPQTNAPYEYETTGTLAFKLCATFTLPSDASFSKATRATPYPAMPYGAIDANENWKHVAGKTCFDRTIDPKLNALPTKY
ncbi:MAG: hypothetical protein A3C06_03765 [Candidatus Taylorbacteria bacterium RIFCSPHIGHO2_02_FULL_46_13]|uniref:DUF5671 domain-containing protein n=1 Tax=Candidatus Taylorbacteria bacterium RIFCSPHIGHO2_02_FULL_46_13 TaxID=1802312 RepID=A0A1G2MTI2_9BACT|nr:MAG: hypothetical protein A3C06_03765 [Candidatus Taylorbacteria bacterium RIFCSPHIGHO2_02_FULL_46_13]